MIELLQQYGFGFDSKCTCDGYLTHKYKRYTKDEGIIQVSWRITKYKFKIKRDGQTVIGWTPISVANEVFKKHIQEKRPEVIHDLGEPQSN